MNLENEFSEIRAWAKARGLYDKGDVKTQTLKLQEEVGELSKAVIEKDFDAVRDAMGDCVVVLTNLAHLAGTTLEYCINEAFNEIKDRTGRMDNGTFIRTKGSSL